MTPASRNRVLMIGGGLILIALLLVCGPLNGYLGQETSSPPSVAAGPVPRVVPIVPPLVARVEEDQAIDGSLDDSLTGALAGGVLGAKGPSVAGLKSALVAEPVSVVAAALPPVVAAKAVPKATRKATPRRRAPLPSVSAPPPVLAAVPTEPTAQERVASAREAFAHMRTSGIAGNLVDRFAPPVDSGPAPSAIALAASPGFSTRGATVLRACDTPGAGCQTTLPRVGVGVPPIGPGAR